LLYLLGISTPQWEYHQDPTLYLNIVYDKENPRIKVNEYFPTMEDFRMALRQYGINKGFQVHKVKTDKTRYRAQCKATGCPWRIVARKLRGLPAVVVLL